MTRYIAIAAVALTTLTGAASAMNNPAAGLDGFVTPAQAAQLDERTISKIKAVIHGGDTEGEKQSIVRNLIRKAG